MKEVATAFPLARTIETRSVDKATVEKLFSTSGNSYATTKTDSAQIKLDPNKDKKGPLTLGVAGTYRGKVVISTPGSPNAVKTAWTKLIQPELEHLAWEVTRQS